METWLITLIVVVVVAAVLVAVTAASKARRRREANAIGLPPLGAIAGDGPPVAEPEPSVDAQPTTSPRRAATERPVR